MKKIISLLLVLSFFFACKKDAKIPETKPSTVEGLELTFVNANIGIEVNARKMLFLNETTGFIVGYYGGVYKTEDGGQTWTNRYSAGVPLFDIYFLNNNDGFVVGGQSSCGGTGCTPKGAVILRTKDGGQTWENVSLNLTGKIELQSIHFIDTQVGYAVGLKTVLSTTDGGATWKENGVLNQGSVFMDVKFRNKNDGMILTPGGELFKTKDAGTNWTVTKPFQNGCTNTFNIVNENLVYAVSGCKIYRSPDFGETWTEITNFPIGTSAMIYKTESIGFAFGGVNFYEGDYVQYTTGAVYYTTDGGATWKGNSKLSEMSGINISSMVNSSLGFGMSNNVIVKVKRL